MAFAGDKTLAGRPDMFELVENPKMAKMFRTMAFIGPLIPLGFAVWAWMDDSMIMVGIALFMAVGSIFAFLSMAKNSRQWARRGGAILKNDRINIDVDASEARQRLASKDARIYTPMKNSSSSEEHQSQWMEYFWVDGERVTYVVVVERHLVRKEAPPILELRDREHDEFHAAVKAGWDKPFGGPIFH